MITTPNFGLKKPEDGDVSDLRIWIGDNMDIIDLNLGTGGGGGTASVTTWARNLYGPFVYQGMDATKNATNPKQVDVTTGVAYPRQTDYSLERRAFTATSYTTTLANATYLLDMNPDGTMTWGTAHSTQANYLPILIVTTDVNGDVATIEERSKVADMFPFSTEVSVKAPPNGMTFGNFRIVFNSTTNSLDFVYIA